MAEPAVPPKSNAKQQPVTVPVRRKRGRWLKRGFVLLVLFGIFGWFAPVIISSTGLRNQLPKMLLPNFHGSVSFGESTLGWMSPVIINNFRLDDQDGQPVLEVGKFTSSETLWSLVTRPGNLGTFKLVEPVVHVVMHDSDSNVEQLLKQLLSGSSSGHRTPDVLIEIDNARIDLEHLESKRQSTIDQISLRLVASNGAIDDVDLAIGNPPTPGSDVTTAEWVAARYGRPLPSDTGPANASIENGAGDNSSRETTKPKADPISPSSGTRNAAIRASHWKLERFSPLLSRFMPNAELSGELLADASIAITPTEMGFDWDWNGTVSIQKFVVEGIDALNRDHVALNQVNLSGRAVATKGRLAMHDVKVTSDVGELTATGDIPLIGSGTKSSLELVQSLLSDEDYHLTGHVDLKKLAALLPQTLRIRDGVEITSGDVRVQFVGVDVQGVRRWSGTSDIVGLTALRQGQTIPWDKPIAARINAHRDQKGIVIDLMECKSDFLQVSGKGTLDDARFTASGDLAKLLQNIERFVDLGIDQLSGQMRANGELKRSDADHVALVSKVMLDDFAYVVSKSSVWREKHLELSVAGTGQTDAGSKLTRVDTGEVHLSSGGDTFDLVLQQPVDLAVARSAYRSSAKMSGGLTSWQNRIRPFVAVDNWSLVGTMNLSTSVSADAGRVEVSQLTLGLRELAASGPGWLIKDPEIKLETAGTWDIATKTWSSPKTSIAGKSLTTDITDLEFGVSQSGIARLTGKANYRADLVQLSSWKNLAIQNPQYYIIGTLTGTANLTHQDRLLVGNVDAQVEKLVVAGQGMGANGQPQWVALWKEPQLKLTGKGSYDGTGDSATVDSSQLEVDGLSVTANGKLMECSTNQRIDLTGDLAYDWDALLKRFGSQIGQNIQISGKDHRPFSMKGSLASLSNRSVPSSVSGTPAAPVSFQPGSRLNSTDSTGRPSDDLVDLTGNAGLGWTMATVYGIKAGAGDVSAQIDHGTCRFAPLDIAVNDGRLHATPTIFLNRSPMTLALPQERLIDHVSLSRELCNSSLRFLTPMLSDSAQVEGKISIDVREALIPLSAGTSGTGDGVLLIHGAQARSGSLSQQIVLAINQVRSIITRQPAGSPNGEQVWLELPEQQVPFKLEQGRVYHDGLTFIVSNVRVKTSGSVGMDSSLNLIAQIAIRDDWLGNNKLVAGMKGKSIQIPISGTTSQPRIDPSIFSNLAQQLGGSAIEGILQEKVGDGLNGVINNGLDKLLRGNK